MKKYIALLSLMPFFANSCENCIQDLFTEVYYIKEEMDFDFSETQETHIYRIGKISGYLEAANIMRNNHSDEKEIAE